MYAMATPSTHRYRRRIPSLSAMLRAATVFGIGSMFVTLGSAAPRRQPQSEPLVALDTATLTRNMRHWTADYAVMFYAPWCAHCKESFMPMWEDVAVYLAQENPKRKKKLVMGKFNCEQDTAAEAFCREVNLMYYPTFMFFGAGKFHDHDPVSGMVLGPRPTQHESAAKFSPLAMVYPEVMADWVKTMHLISGSNRMMEKLNIFGRSSATASQERLASEIETLERQNQQLQLALTGGPDPAAEADEGRNPMYGYGDPYRELLEVGYDAQFEPVMICVIDMAEQYCDIEGVKERDPYCKTFERCIATNFEASECWPASCPFNKEGCEITSFCLSPELLNSYMDTYEQAVDVEDDEIFAALQEEQLQKFDSWMDDSVAQAEGVPEKAEAARGDGFPGLPPFLGRRPAAGHGGGMDRAADERGETVAA